MSHSPLLDAAEEHIYKSGDSTKVIAVYFSMMSTMALFWGYWDRKANGKLVRRMSLMRRVLAWIGHSLASGPPRF